MKYVLSGLCTSGIIRGILWVLSILSLRYSLQARKWRLRGLKHTQTRPVYFLLRAECGRADQTQCLMVLLSGPKSEGSSSVSCIWDLVGENRVPFVVSESFVPFYLYTSCRSFHGATKSEWRTLSDILDHPWDQMAEGESAGLGFQHRC